jgi:uncharacterized protein
VTFSSPFHLLAKPSGAICNLDCEYCFFLSKEALYPDSHFRMDEATLEAYLGQLLDAHPEGEVTIAWQGGEPTLMGLDFFRRSLGLAEALKRPGQTLLHTIQTNGTRLDSDWATFFHENNFLVGLSLDGPQPIHDRYRKDKGGAGTFERVVQAARLLQVHQVEYNILCTVNAANAHHPLEVYRFFRDELQAHYIQFIPIVERATPESLPAAEQGWGGRNTARPLYTQSGNLVTERSVQPDDWGRFLTAIFDEWVLRDVGKVFVQLFDSALGAWVGAPASLCIFAETCGRALALEHNGDVYSCDHYVEPAYRLGNIHETPLIQLVESPVQLAFGAAKRDSLPRYCRECEVRFACQGECPRNRFIQTPDGEPGLNYLCAGYKAFFTHIDRPMRMMAQLLRSDRAPAEVMHYLAMEAMTKAASQPGQADKTAASKNRKRARKH